MRIKDFIIIGTAIFAMLRWTYQQKEDLSLQIRSLNDQIRTLSDRITIIERNVSTISARRDGKE